MQIFFLCSSFIKSFIISRYQYDTQVSKGVSITKCTISFLWENFIRIRKDKEDCSTDCCKYVGHLKMLSTLKHRNVSGHLMEKELKIPILKKPHQTSPLNILQSFCSKRSIPKPLYILTDIVGKGSNKFCEVRVKIGSIQLVGNGPSLKKARQRGAENMLTKLRALGDQLHQEVHKKVDLYESYFIDNYDFKQTLTWFRSFWTCHGSLIPMFQLDYP